MACQADTATQPMQIGTAQSGTFPTQPDRVRHVLAWRGLTWLVEVRVDRSEVLANTRSGLGAKLAASRSERLAL